MLRLPASILVIALAASACTDSQDTAAADSELARDLALAVQTQRAIPQFSDSAISTAPEPRPTASPARQTPVTKSTAPARRTAPVVTTPKPRPSAPRVIVEQPAPQPAPAPPRRAPGFGAGTSFGVSTKTQVCTTNMPGDKIVATLNESVSGQNGAYIPAGTSVVLEVASVTPGDSPESAQITLRIRSIVIDDQSVSVPAQVAILSDLERREIPRTSGGDKKKVIGGAIAGAVIGQVLGRDTRSTVIGAAAGGAAGAAAAAASRKYDACLPAGANVRITTSEQITLGE
ncbi:MAG TPA: hypothetical protein VEB19_00530 [Gemmatimonadaceae bacterium]|nr:hypothetical protein [Gemmatimonadaceae bacterium]